MFVHPEGSSTDKWNEVGLDQDGRIPAGMLPHNPRPALLNYQFRTWLNFLQVSRSDGGVFDKIIADAKTVFSARTGRSARSYSSGETYFLSAMATPRCGMEHLARRVFDLHTSGLLVGEDYDPACSGAEWWSLVLDRDDDVGFHWDRDYALEDEDGAHLHPHLATVTYLSSVGGPTTVVSVVGTTHTGYDY
jgi:hypothetical protein